MLSRSRSLRALCPVAPQSFPLLTRPLALAGETVELKGKYADRGYVPGEEEQQTADVPLAPVLAATVLGVLAVTVLLAQRPHF